MAAIATDNRQVTTWRRRTAYWWFVLSAVVVLAFGITPYLVASLPALARSDVGLARNYVDRGPVITTALYVHIMCAGLALMLSPLQFAARCATGCLAFTGSRVASCSPRSSSVVRRG